MGTPTARSKERNFEGSSRRTSLGEGLGKGVELILTRGSLISLTEYPNPFLTGSYVDYFSSSLYQ